MSETIKALELRVKELEDRLNKTEGTGAVAKDATGSPATATPAGTGAIGDNAGPAAAGAGDSAGLASTAPSGAGQAPVAADAAKSQADAKKEEPWVTFFRGTEISGFVDGYFGYNFNRPTVDTQLRNFDTKHDQFSLNLAELALEKLVTPDSRFGFRFDFDYGPATEIVHAAEPGGTNVFHNIEQAYISYLAPVGKSGLQIDVGKFVTPFGAEVIESKDNWNYSRSLLFALAIPYYHFGVRATYNFSDKFSLAAFLVNGWNNVVDNNKGKSGGLQATWKPNAKFSWVNTYMGGPEQPNDNHDIRHLFDSVMTYNATPKVSFMANYDYGMDSVLGARVHWTGLAGYTRFQVNKWWALSPRIEWYNDVDGFTTGVAQRVKEFTLTSEHKIMGQLVTRLEYRHDWSNQPFFQQNYEPTPFTKTQSTIALGVFYFFSSKAGQ